MSNQRKPRFGKHRGVSRSKRAMQKGLEERRNFPLHDDSGPKFDTVGRLDVTLPEDKDVVVLKTVPAMHTGLPGGEHEGERIQVGVAYLHSDGTVGLRYDEDAPLWAMEEIQGYADQIGYSLGEGGFTNGAS